MKVRILGCGTSSGVPRIGPDWGSCDPAEPRNRRRRQSILVEHGRSRILVDTGPDLREQLIDANIGRIDAVIWTHDHADHTAGIDDLRQLAHRTTIPGWARPGTAAALAARYAYVFRGVRGYAPVATLASLPDMFAIGDIVIRVVDQPHGAVSSAGLRFEADGHAIGYATDFGSMTAAMRALYAGVDLWIADTLRHAPHPTHPTVADVIGWHRELGTGRTVTVHMDYSLDYATLAAALPEGMIVGHDGLELDLGAADGQ